MLQNLDSMDSKKTRGGGLDQILSPSAFASNRRPGGTLLLPSLGALSPFSLKSLTGDSENMSAQVAAMRVREQQM